MLKKEPYTSIDDYRERQREASLAYRNRMKAEGYVPRMVYIKTELRDLLPTKISSPSVFNQILFRMLDNDAFMKDLDDETTAQLLRDLDLWTSKYSSKAAYALRMRKK